MKKRRLGQSALEVSPVGFGCMSIGIADVYTSSAESEDDGIAIVHREAMPCTSGSLRCADERARIAIIHRGAMPRT